MIAEFFIDQLKGSVIVCGVLDAEKVMFRSLSKAGQGSAVIRSIKPLFAKPDMFGKMREKSLICSAMSKLFSFLLMIIKAVYDAFDHTPVFRLITRFADWVLSLRFSDICALVATLMLCVYHDNWNNGYMLIISVLLAALYLIRLTKNEKSKSRLPVSLYLFILISAAIIPLVGDMSSNIRIYTYFISAFAFFFCIAGSVESLEDLRRFLMILYIAVLFNSFLSIVQGYYGVPVNTSYTDVTTNPDTPGRVYASFSNPNNFAEILCLLSPACFAAFLSSERMTKSAKTCILLSFVFPLIALVLTYSRSAWISLALTVGMVIAIKNVALIPVALVLIFVAIPFLPSSVKNRVLSLFSGNDSSVGYRIYIWQGCYGTMKNQPFGGFGLGPDNFFLAYSRFMNEHAMKAPHSHNLYLEIWMETGFAGFLSYMTFFCTTLKYSFLNAIRKNSKYHNYSLALFSAMFGMIFMSMVEYIWFYPRTMLCYFAVLGLIWSVLRMAAKEECCE